MNRPYRIRRLISLTCAMVLAATITIWLVREHHQLTLNHELIAALKRSDADTVYSLLAAGADPNARDTPHRNEALLQRIKHVFHPPKDLSPTALSVAIHRSAQYYNAFPPQTTTIVRDLLAKGADVNAAQVPGNYPLERYLTFPEGATSSQCAEKRELLQTLLAAGAKTETRDDTGSTPLINAIVYGLTDSTRLLLDHGANPNTSDFTNTPLSLATYFDQIDIVRALLKKGADVNARDTSGQPPISLCFGEMTPSGFFFKQTVRTETLQVLIAAGANTEVVVPDGHTPLIEACALGRVDVVRILLDHGTNPCPRPSKLGTPFIDRAAKALYRHCKPPQIPRRKALTCPLTTNHASRKPSLQHYGARPRALVRDQTR